MKRLKLLQQSQNKKARIAGLFLSLRKNKMKKLCILYVLIGIVLSSCENKAITKSGNYALIVNSAEDLEILLKHEEYPLISSHRGGDTADFPENCIETFERATTFGPSIIETDIAMTKDSVLILMHDDKLDRTSTGKGFVRDYDYSEIQSFVLKDFKGRKTPYKIPTLDEALQWGMNKVVFTLDVKRGVPYDKVLTSIRKHAAEPYTIVITYNADQAKAFHKLAPDVWLSVSANSAEDIERLNRYKVPTDRVVAFVGIKEPSLRTINYMKKNQIPMILGTIGNLDKRARTSGDHLYYSLFGKGIKILSSDRNKEASGQALKFAEENNLTSEFIKRN